MAILLTEPNDDITSLAEEVITYMQSSGVPQVMLVVFYVHSFTELCYSAN